MKRLTQRRLLFLMGILCAVPALRAQPAVLSGIVTDASTGEPLSAATIRVAWSARGTIANAHGEFRLALEQADSVIVVTYVGYQTDSVRVPARPYSHLHVAMTPGVVPMSEVIVVGEDPGMGIMRKVIANKHRWMEGLNSYRFDAFTRQVIRRDTAIAQIAESYSTGYWQRGDTLREVIRQRRQTENVPMAKNMASVGGIVNFYDDDVRFAGFTFVGPASSDAFEYYRFTLEGVRVQDSREVFVIRMHPLSRVTPLFHGILHVIDGDFAILRLEVSPNEVFAFPLIKHLQLVYAQQFIRFEERFWLPVDVQTHGSAEINFPGLTMPKIGIDVSSSLYEYQVNASVPDSISHQPRRLVVREADKIDSLFWQTHDVLPLTGEEVTAYASLDSTQTLQRQFSPSGALSRLDSVEFGPLGYLDPRFNRVEGWHLGLGHQHDSVAGTLSIGWKAGYGVADRRWKGSVTWNVPLDSGTAVTAVASAFHDMGQEPENQLQASFTGMLAALFSKKDYWDYFYARGWSVGLRTTPMRGWDLSLTFRCADEFSAQKNTDFSVLYPGDRFRANPPADEGRVQSLRFHGRIGESVPFPGLFLADFVEWDLDRGGGVLGGDFTFSRVNVRAEFHPTTFLRRTSAPARFSIRVEAGGGWGDMPRQRLLSLESSLSGYGPYGTFRAMEPREYIGDRSWALFLEHNFRSLPFLWMNIPFLYQNTIDVIPFVNIGRCWMDNPRYGTAATLEREWYVEAGIGIGRIFGILRFDVTRRFAAPRGVAFTVSLMSPL